MSRINDLTGKKFNHITLLERRIHTTSGGNKITAYLCKCDCGKEFIAIAQNITRGATKSCGCYNKQAASERSRTHGMSGTRLYNIYASMKERCTNKNASNYERYGGRGIRICEEWLNSPSIFFEWAKLNGYRDDLSLDRINNNGNYSPDNCRWATPYEQGNNKRRNRMITYNGVTKTLSQWSNECGINPDCIANRLNKGWSIDDAFTIKPRKGNNGYNVKRQR